MIRKKENTETITLLEAFTNEHKVYTVNFYAMVMLALVIPAHGR